MNGKNPRRVIALVVLCGIIFLVVLGGYSELLGPGKLNAWGKPARTGSLAASGQPYWSGEPDTFIDVRNVPAGDDFVAISAGVPVMLALRSNGSIECWGDYREGLCDFPHENDISAISSGNGDCIVALRKNGSVACWRFTNGSCEVPAGNDFVAIAKSDGPGLALRENGTLVLWGSNRFEPTYVPQGNDFIAIAAGSAHNLALRSNGTIACWELHADPSDDLCAVPPGNDYVSIAASGMDSLALRANGELVSWSLAGKEYVPPGNDYRAISAGNHQNLAIRSDGTIVCWGTAYDNPCNSSANQNTIAASIGGLRALTIRNPHAKEILAGEWKRTTGRIVRTSAANTSDGVRHPAMYPNTPFIITTILPVVPESVMTYTAAVSMTDSLPGDIPYQDPDLLKNPYVPYREFPIITPEQAVEELKTHRLTVDETFLWHNSIRTSDAVVITNVSFRYIRQLSPSHVTCYQPAYTFSGYVQNGTVRSTGFTEDIPATDHLVEFDFL